MTMDGRDWLGKLAEIQIRGAVVLDCAGTDPFRAQMSCSDGGRIVAIGPSAHRPPPGRDVLVIDGWGCTLMPGLSDAHVHLGCIGETGDHATDEWSSYVLRVACAITELVDEGFATVRNAGGLEPSYARAVDRGEIRGPRILAYRVGNPSQGWKTGDSNDGDEVLGLVSSLSNEGRWGPDDDLGTLNYVDDAKRVEAAQLARTGIVISLARDISDRVSPKNPIPLVHRMLYSAHTNPIAVADRTEIAPHGWEITHWTLSATCSSMDGCITGDGQLTRSRRVACDSAPSTRLATESSRKVFFSTSHALAESVISQRTTGSSSAISRPPRRWLAHTFALEML
jgi:hypothetical protein